MQVINSSPALTFTPVLYQRSRWSWEGCRSYRLQETLIRKYFFSLCCLLVLHGGVYHRNWLHLKPRFMAGNVCLWF